LVQMREKKETPIRLGDWEEGVDSQYGMWQDPLWSGVGEDEWEG
jgi:hypothetical protein